MEIREIYIKIKFTFLCSVHTFHPNKFNIIQLTYRHTQSLREQIPTYLRTNIRHIGTGNELSQKSIKLGSLNVPISCWVRKLHIFVLDICQFLNTPRRRVSLTSSMPHIQPK